MSKQGRRAHVKRAKHLAAFVPSGLFAMFFIMHGGSDATFLSRATHIGARGSARRRKLINRAHALRGGYQS